jgi:uridine kinase
MDHLNQIAQDLAQIIDVTARNHNPLMVNISGCMGSGKSTYSQVIAKQLIEKDFEVLVVSEDDFLQPREFRANLQNEHYSTGEWKGKSHWEVHENWLKLDLMKQVILDLKAHKKVEYYAYSRESGTLSSEVKKLEPAQIIIFESSIFSELFDLVILIEVKEKELIRRKTTRDTDLRNQETILKYHNLAQWPFWLRHKPTNPTFIVDNNNLYSPRLIAPSK